MMKMIMMDWTDYSQARVTTGYQKQTNAIFSTLLSLTCVALMKNTLTIEFHDVYQCPLATQKAHQHHDTAGTYHWLSKQLLHDIN